MNEPTTLQIAKIIEDKVEAVLKNVMLPEIQHRVNQLQQEQIAIAVRYLIGSDVHRVIHEVVREEIAGRLRVTVEITDE